MARLIPLDGARDLIVAPATAPGVGAIAIVRLSGPGAIHLATRIHSARLKEHDPGSLRLGSLKDPSTAEVIDRCLAVGWLAPKSYTGEEMVEFHLHGSPAIVDRTVALCVATGARQAHPGEFTRRAFIAGKIDLAQAEAVANLTNARTDAARRAALAQMGGGLSDALAAIRRDLVQVTAELEASVDYPEEHLPATQTERLVRLVEKARLALHALASSFERGRLLAHGARVVLAGAPNAGKSSVFNALLRRERAIVSPHPGTTRDSLECMLDLQGVPLTLIDTAGLREPGEEIEAIGIERTRALLPSADLVLFLVNPMESPDEALKEFQAVAAIPHVVVVTRRDLVPDAARQDSLASRFHGPGGVGWIAIHSASPRDIERLEELLLAHLRAAPTDGGDTNMLTSARHRDALRAAAQSLGAVPAGLAAGLAPELIVLDLAEALSRIDSVTGAGSLDEDILDAIFSTFCLGK